MIGHDNCFFRVQGDEGKGTFVGGLEHVFVQMVGHAFFFEQAAFVHDAIVDEGLHGGHDIIHGVHHGFLEADGGLLLGGLGVEVVDILVEVLHAAVEVLDLIGQFGHLGAALAEFVFEGGDIGVFFVEFVFEAGDGGVELFGFGAGFGQLFFKIGDFGLVLLDGAVDGFDLGDGVVGIALLVFDHDDVFGLANRLEGHLNLIDSAE